VLCVGQGIVEEADQHGLKFFRPQNEQGMVHIAAAFAKHRNRLAGYQCILGLHRMCGVADFGNELRFRDTKSGTLTGDCVPIDFRKRGIYGSACASGTDGRQCDGGRTGG
jgi:TPP-dependent trihydroxycyclohexane-1,2-dione (THcHDO) dehydratase